LKGILDTYGDESAIAAKLTGFECRLDPDIEQFLRQWAIPFEKAHKCRTYLFIDGEFVKVTRPKIVAYLSVAISNLKLRPEVSKTMKKRLDGIFQNDECPCYLIGQLGKDDKYSDEIEGRELISYAMDVIRTGQRAVGGRFVRADVRRNEKLIRFYERNNFIKIQADENSNFIQFVRFF
jgi:hypothetical protein